MKIKKVILITLLIALFIAQLSFTFYAKPVFAETSKDIEEDLLFYTKKLYNQEMHKIASFLRDGIEENTDEVQDIKPLFNLSLTSTKTKVKSGDTFEVLVTLNNLQNIEKGLVAIKGTLVYDDSILEIVPKTIENSDGTTKDIYLVGQNGLDFSFYNSDKGIFVNDLGQLKTTTDLFKVTFKVKEDITSNTNTEIMISGITGSEGDQIIRANDSNEVNVKVLKKIMFDKYTISNDVISNIPPKTTVETFRNHLKNIEDLTLVFTDKNGRVLTDTDIITTETKLKSEENEEEYTLCIIGDIDGDGEITLIDLAQLKLHLLEKEILTGVKEIAADVNRDGEISLIDLSQVKLVLIEKLIIK